jgi:hypothetical protein
MSSSKKKKLLAQIPLWFMFLVVTFFILKDIYKEEDKTVDYKFQKEGELVFASASGQLLKRIDIEVADTEYDRQKGLMFRENLGESEGMLFVFPTEDSLSFWMRNTYISLDIIFINKNKEIVTIYKSTRVNSDQSYQSIILSKYVVEVNAGFTDKHGIRVGDKVIW